MHLTDLLAIENGTKFYRADLHIHSYGSYASYDVTDTQMTPANIIDEAIKENISVISITDHNKIGNIPEALSKLFKRLHAVIGARYREGQAFRNANQKCVVIIP